MVLLTAPQVVVAAHPPLLAQVLERVLGEAAREHRPDGEEGAAVQVITLDRTPDPEAVHVLRLPETAGDPAVLESPGHSTWVVLSSVDDVTELVTELLRRC